MLTPYNITQKNYNWANKDLPLTWKKLPTEPELGPSQQPGGLKGENLEREELSLH